MKKRLTKSNDNIVISGTLAGIAEYFGIDPTIIRVLFVAITVMGIGSPILFYIILMVIIPRKARTNTSVYGHQNQYYQANSKSKKAPKDVTDTVKNNKQETNEDDWSDF